MTHLYLLRHRTELRAFALAATVLAAGCAAPEVPPTEIEKSRLALITERPGTARVTGIGPIVGFAKGRDCTFMHCLELVLYALGRDIGYDELMGISGLAFRVQMHAVRWDVGNPDPFVGENCVDPLFPAIGCEYELHVVRREELAAADALRKAIAESIDAGVPVLAANIIPPEDWGVITGYERRGWAWQCRAYHGGAEAEDKPATAWPTAVVIFQVRRPRPPVVPVHQASIRRAVELFEKRASGSYAVGENAFDHWCQMLRTARDRRYIHPNAWTYYSLIDARGAAVRYLRSISAAFGPKGQYLQEAAGLYEQEIGVLIEGARDVPAERQFPTDMPPAELRTRQIETLTKAKLLEQRAVDALQKAL